MDVIIISHIPEEVQLLMEHTSRCVLQTIKLGEGKKGAPVDCGQAAKWPPKNVPLLTTGTCGIPYFLWQRGFTDVIKLRSLKWRDYFRLSRWAQCHHRVLIRRRQEFRVNRSPKCPLGGRASSVRATELIFNELISGTILSQCRLSPLAPSFLSVFQLHLKDQHECCLLCEVAQEEPARSFYL